MLIRQKPERSGTESKNTKQQAWKNTAEILRAFSHLIQCNGPCLLHQFWPAAACLLACTKEMFSGGSHGAQEVLEWGVIGCHTPNISSRMEPHCTTKKAWDTFCILMGHSVPQTVVWGTEISFATQVVTYIVMEGQGDFFCIFGILQQSKNLTVPS